MRISDDTIVAVATAAGRGAIAVVRLSGPRALEIARRVLRPDHMEARRARLVSVVDPEDGEVVDRVVATPYVAPRSYTGEDTVELSGHGGALSATAITALLIRQGARQAEPGEFTRRALLNGKLDLMQAEGIADIVDAKTEASRRAALLQVDGGVSRAVEQLRSELLDLESLLAYEIDFPEEDSGPIPRSRIDESCEQLRGEIVDLLRTARVGEAVRDGALVVLAGRPNVGKSSLLNALVGHRRVLVSAVPGTTRDAIEVPLELGRWPVRLIDTAGLRQSDDAIERDGVEMSEAYLSKAQLVLLCDDDVASLSASSERIRSVSEAPLVLVHTKSDLRNARPAAPIRGTETEAVEVSATTRAGLDLLVELVQRRLDEAVGTLEAHRPILMRARHEAALRSALGELQLFEEVWRTGSVPVSIAAVHVRAAAYALADLVGSIEIDDVLARVFASFCVGK